VHPIRGISFQALQHAQAIYDFVLNLKTAVETGENREKRMTYGFGPRHPLDETAPSGLRFLSL
jgi:hypothetical protein